MRDYPLNDSLRERFNAHREKTGQGFRWYAERVGMSYRGLHQFSAGKCRILYEFGKRLDDYLATDGY